MYTKAPISSICIRSSLIVCFLLLANGLFAGRPNVINFSPREYRAADKNWSIQVDENGILYFGNDRGLLQFDGVDWMLFQLPNKGIVRSVGVKNGDTIFSGGYEEFGIWNRGLSGSLEYKSISTQIDYKEIKNSDFWRIFVTPKGVYFQSFSSIYFYDYKKVVKLKLIEAPVLLLNQVRGKLLYQKMKNGIFVLDGYQARHLPGSNIFADTDVRVILPYGKDGYLFATTTKGVVVYEHGVYREWNSRLSAFLNQKDINVGILSKRGSYVFGTLLDGIYETDLSGNILNQISSNGVLQNNSVLSICEDNLNNIWLGLDRGISYVSFKQDLSYYTNATSHIGAVYSASFWKNYLLIGTNQGVFAMPKADLQSYNPFSHIKLIHGTEGQVWNLKAIDGKLYVCHNSGLLVIDESLNIHPYPGIATGIYDISKITIREADYLALATYQSVKFINLKTNVLFSPVGIDEPIIHIETDHLGNLWLEHPNRGAYRCVWDTKQNAFKSISYHGGNTGDGLPYKLQLFRVGGRTNMVGNDRVYHYDDLNNKIVPNNVLNHLFKGTAPLVRIHSCSNNLYWALSDNAFYLFMYDGYKASILKTYTIGYNLSLIYNYENIVPLSDSLNFLALDDGFILQTIPDRISANDRSSAKIDAPRLRAFKSQDNKKQVRFFSTANTEIEVSNSFNTIEILFSIKDAYANNIACQYRMDGVDVAWSRKAHLSKVLYERLPAGSYSFRIRSVDVGGNISKDTVLHFKILPPWYNTSWAYLLYLFLVASALYLLWQFNLRRYRRQHLRKMRKLETMQLKILADELQAQVNQKNAELVTQTSFIIHKNELIEKIKALIDDFYTKNKSAVLQQLIYKINSLLSNDLDTEEDWKNFLIKFEEKHTNFFKKLKAGYPALTSTDLRLCACLKLNMETKDIASLMSLSVRAVENNRYRLRKKLNLATEQNLNEFFISFD